MVFHHSLKAGKLQRVGKTKRNRTRKGEVKQDEVKG